MWSECNATQTADAEETSTETSTGTRPSILGGRAVYTSVSGSPDTQDPATKTDQTTPKAGNQSAEGTAKQPNAGKQKNPDKKQNPAKQKDGGSCKGKQSDGKGGKSKGPNN